MTTSRRPVRLTRTLTARPTDHESSLYLGDPVATPLRDGGVRRRARYEAPSSYAEAVWEAGSDLADRWRE